MADLKYYPSRTPTPYIYQYEPAPTPTVQVTAGLTQTLTEINGVPVTVVDAAEWWYYTQDGSDPYASIPTGYAIYTFTETYYAGAAASTSIAASAIATGSVTPTVAGNEASTTSHTKVYWSSTGWVVPSATSPEQYSSMISEHNAGIVASAQNGPANPLVAPIAGTFGGVFGLCLLATGIVCYKRRKAFKREHAGSEEAGPLGSSGPQGTHGVGAETTMVQRQFGHTRPIPLGDGFEGYYGVNVTPLPPPLTRYSRVPPLPTRPADEAGSLTPAPRYRQIRSSVAASSWADDSEFDAIATDGSSYARTLSSYSVSSDVSDATATANENPFDHPAYTLMPARRRPARGPANTQQQEGSDTGSPVDINTNSDPFADSHSASTSRPLPTLSDPTLTYTTFNTNSTPSLSSPISPVAPISPVLPVPAQAILARPHTTTNSLDDHFSHPSPKLSRTTFIQHVDGGQASLERANAAEPERLGGGEVHIPPSYMEMYPRAGARSGSRS